MVAILNSDRREFWRRVELFCQAIQEYILHKPDNYGKLVDLAEQDIYRLVDGHREANDEH
uniref:Uncharacterized protein n=1 Tax=viral metagenome TaxID=1070528 RepID=A0A6H2A0H3_9ZZZZ